MHEKKVQNIPLVAFGIAILWVGWGNALDLLLPGGHPCGPPNLEGLHLDSTLQLVYANEQCSVVVYEYAWLAFLSLSALGLAAVIGGGHRMKGVDRTD
jgi:hypothetical protein